MRVGSAGSSSIFSRNRRMWTVTVDWSPKVSPRTCSRSSARRNTRPGWRIQEDEQVELAHGQGDIGAAEPDDAAGGVDRQVAVGERLNGGRRRGSATRRSTDRTRRTSSLGENGLVM